MRRVYIKVVAFFYFIILQMEGLFAVGKQSSQIIESGHWIYDDLEVLSAENKTVMFLESQPLSVGEIRFYFIKIDYEKLSEAGKAVYERVENFLNKEDDFIKTDGIRLFVNARANPELFYKSNKNIAWSFNPNFKDNPITFPIILGFLDNFTIESDLFLGKSPCAGKKPEGFTNIPISLTEGEFSTPDFAYFSGEKTFEKCGIAAHMGKEGRQIGQTKLGSVIYNNTFDTDFYFNFNLFSEYIKFAMDVAEVAPSKYLYLHHLSLRPFKNFNITVVEGSLLNGPFELRYLNPLMLMHQFGSWNDYNQENVYENYRESDFCAYLAFTAEFIPVKNMRIYGLYAQTEILDLGGGRGDKDLAVPDGIGGQLGIEYFIPLKNKAHLKTGIEAVYTSPYLYVKYSPDWSLYRKRRNHMTVEYVDSWIGFPYGPDCFAINVNAEYDSNKKWKAEAGYTLAIHGENNSDNLFKDENKVTNKYGNEEWTYYPAYKYDTAQTDKAREEAVKEGRNLWMSGIEEYNNKISLKGSYKILENLEVTGQLNYNFVYNNSNIKENFQQGVELAVAVTYEFF